MSEEGSHMASQGLEHQRGLSSRYCQWSQRRRDGTGFGYIRSVGDMEVGDVDEAEVDEVKPAAIGDEGVESLNVF